jgi:hypothetical protein
MKKVLWEGGIKWGDLVVEEYEGGQEKVLTWMSSSLMSFLGGQEVEVSRVTSEFPSLSRLEWRAREAER